MRTDVIETAPHVSTTYPCLKKSKVYGSIILFIAPSTGVVINPGASCHSLGYYSDTWTDTFVPFHGTVRLIED